MLTLSIFTFANAGLVVLAAIIIILGIMNSATSRAFHEAEAENIRLRSANGNLDKSSVEMQTTIQNQVDAILRLQKQSDEYFELENKNKKTISDLNGQIASLKQDNATLVNQQIPVFVYLDREPAIDEAKDLKSYKTIITIAKKLVDNKGLKHKKVTALRAFLHFVEKQQTEDTPKKPAIIEIPAK